MFEKMDIKMNADFVNYRKASSQRLPSKASGMKNGFSLVELSIVLVILGLLTGGILAGQNLIRAAELRSVSTQYNQIMAATYTFRDQYFALPGDMPNAINFWDAANASPSTCATTPSTGPETCNGNGNGRIISEANSHEAYRFWQHLANAGLIEGSYTGIADGTTSYSSTEANSLRGKLSTGLWFAWNWAGYNGVGSAPALAAIQSYNNVLQMGAPTTNNFPTTGILTPEEMWNIDTKLDDGRPGYGKLIAYPYTTACTDATGITDLDSEYAYSVTNKNCTLLFVDIW